MNETERFAWPQFAFIPYVGAESFLILLQYFGSAQTTLDTSAEKIAVLMYHKQAAEVWRNVEKRHLAQKSAEAALKWEMQDGCWLMPLQDQDFPEMLTQGITAPPVLSLCGGAGLLHEYSAAIVGSRHTMSQAMRIAKGFGGVLSEKGIPVVSGMVSGINTTTHRGASQAGDGTIAVWGTGIDRIYPPPNKSLACEIVEEELIVSEFSLGTCPFTGSFPRHNRLTAALSQITLVVEATLESGSLVTTGLMAEIGHETTVVPGPVDNPHSKGCHELIKDSAKLVECLDDIVQECPQLLRDPPLLPYVIKKDTSETRKPRPPATIGRPSENVGTETGRQAASSSLLNTMGYNPVHPGTLAQQLRFPVADVYAELLELELDGRVASLAGGHYQRIEAQK